MMRTVPIALAVAASAALMLLAVQLGTSHLRTRPHSGGSIATNALPETDRFPTRRRGGAIGHGGSDTVVQAGAPASGRTELDKAVKQQREMLGADPWANPGHLDIERGETLWRTPRGPRRVALTACDLGKGPGVLDGAYAELPRYFADADRVLDLEGRLLWCMETLQGFARVALVAAPYPQSGQPTSDLSALAIYIASKSNGTPFAPRHDHPREREALAMGERFFHRRQGPMDFSCASCHSTEAKRIRLQELSNLSTPAGARSVMGDWPAYRVSSVNTMSMQHRIYDCFWQMRLPPIEIASPVAVALISYLNSQAKGAKVAVPGLKR
jgi:sulfur-oxidizing protein SoxA